MSVIQRNVRGSEAEKEHLRHRFTAMRVWNGLSSLFFTLNPNDIRSPLTLAMVDKDQYHIESFSVDWKDNKYDSFVTDMLAPRPRLLH